MQEMEDTYESEEEESDKEPQEEAIEYDRVDEEVAGGINSITNDMEAGGGECSLVAS